MRSRAIGKKGQIDELLIHVPIVVYVLFVLFSILLAGGLFIHDKIDSRRAELTIIENRIVHEASVYDAATGRTYIGVIDTNAITAKDLDMSIDYSFEKRLGAQIIVGSGVLFYNQKWYEFLIPQAGYIVSKVEQKIYVIEDGEGKPARIRAVT